MMAGSTPNQPSPQVETPVYPWALYGYLAWNQTAHQQHATSTLNLPLASILSLAPPSQTRRSSLRKPWLTMYRNPVFKQSRSDEGLQSLWLVSQSTTTSGAPVPQAGTLDLPSTHPQTTETWYQHPCHQHHTASGQKVWAVIMSVFKPQRPQVCE